MKLKTNPSDVSVSNILLRNDQYRKNVSAVDHRVKDLCKEKKPYYTDYSNTINTRHLNGSKFHLKIESAKIFQYCQ